MVAIAVLQTDAQHGLLGVFGLLFQDDSGLGGLARWKSAKNFALEPVASSRMRRLYLDVVHAPIARARAV